MADFFLSGQAGLWSLNPADVAIFFSLLAAHVPMQMDADGTVWATAYGKTFYVARLRGAERGKKEE